MFSVESISLGLIVLLGATLGTPTGPTLPALLDVRTEITLADSPTAYHPLNSYTGDVLNHTRCFCENPDQDNTKEKWGHYYKFDYFNWHSGKLFSMDWHCKSGENQREKVGIGWAFDGRCWDERELVKKCKEFADGNKFCYKTGKPKPYSYDRQFNYYYFNDQKRGLPKNYVQHSPRPCEHLCEAELGMIIARDDKDGSTKDFHGDRGHFLVESTSKEYTETDDMCDDCK